MGLALKKFRELTKDLDENVEIILSNGDSIGHMATRALGLNKNILILGKERPKYSCKKCGEDVYFVGRKHGEAMYYCHTCGKEIDSYNTTNRL